MKKEDKEFIRKLVFDKRFPVTEKNSTANERTWIFNIMDKYDKAEIAEVMREAQEEMK